MEPLPWQERPRQRARLPLQHDRKYEAGRHLKAGLHIAVPTGHTPRVTLIRDLQRGRRTTTRGCPAQRSDRGRVMEMVREQPRTVPLSLHSEVILSLQVNQGRQLQTRHMEAIAPPREGLCKAARVSLQVIITTGHHRMAADQARVAVVTRQAHPTRVIQDLPALQGLLQGLQEADPRREALPPRAVGDKVIISALIR